MSLTLVLEVAGGLFAVVAAIYGASRFIDARVEKKISEDVFLKRIGASLRPVAIFDENGSVETLENELIQTEPKRGKRFAWRYELHYEMWNDVFNGKRRFRIEVIL